MRKEITVLLIIAFVGFMTNSPSHGSGAETKARANGMLEYISFPETLPDRKPYPIFTALYGGQPESGFRLDINGIMPDFFKTNVITARLHRANGTIVELADSEIQELNAPFYVGSHMIPGRKMPVQVMTHFPWGPNGLEECWIEVTMGSERYWLEIPYGFDRNPADPLPPSIRGGPPKMIPAMKTLTEHDHVLRWQSVHYDLGKIQKGWRLLLIQSNPFDAESEVVLYRDDIAIGKSMYLWDLHTPRTTLRLLNADGSVISSLCMDIRLHDDGMRRSDTFHINRNGFDHQRCWGQIEISVDDKSYRVVVPSSLYEHTHGHVPVN